MVAVGDSPGPRRASPLRTLATQQMSSHKPKGKQTRWLIRMFKQPGVAGESSVLDGIQPIFNLLEEALQCHYQHPWGSAYTQHQILQLDMVSFAVCQNVIAHLSRTYSKKQPDMMSKHLPTLCVYFTRSAFRTHRSQPPHGSVFNYRLQKVKKD